MVNGPLQTKKPFIHIWDEEFSAVPPEFGRRTLLQPLLIALTGLPVDDYFIRHPGLPFDDAQGQ
jgi:hypothetical protein